MHPPFATRLLDWFDQHGRHHLPWQTPRTPYRVWLSEIMLQQTQVAAVIPYFERFVARFPGIASLAAADHDEVMRHWAGLGYYARARNLHAAARRVMEVHGGVFPDQIDAIMALPGVGRSTAAAIAAQAFGQPSAILDGNVKRVLCRWAGVEGYPGQPAVAARLWTLAESLLPPTRAADYVQAQMDLGATLCTARKPACPRCPLRDDCVAHREQRTAQLPAAKPRRERPQRQAWLLLAEDGQGRVLLEQRPPSGIWGGLWCPPMVSFDEAPELSQLRLEGFDCEDLRPQSVIAHGFTHFDLALHPVHLSARPQAHRLAETPPRAWHRPADLAAGAVALPAPVASYFVAQQQPTDLLGAHPLPRRSQRR